MIDHNGPTYPTELSYMEMAHLLSWHKENEDRAANNRTYVLANYHQQRYEQLERLRKKTDTDHRATLSAREQQ